jgi:hypothetical protein
MILNAKIGNIHIILWCINFVNFVKLLGFKENELKDSVYFVIVSILSILLIYTLVSKYSEIKLCIPNIFNLLLVGLVDYVYIRTFIFEKYYPLCHFSIIVYSFIVLVLLHISLIFEVDV